jgi:selenocysteine-specific elongation factor
MKHIIIGTAGHVDHGKSSLIKALTGTDPDRLKEEKERGITIDIGFASMDFGKDLHVSFVDVPGHERFIKNMLAGVGGIDVVLLVVAADESIMPQTREHLDICRLLDIRSGLVAISKADLVEPEWLELVQLELKELLKHSFLEQSPIIPVSSITGFGLDQLKASIQAIGKSTPSKNTQTVFRLPIDRCFTLRGFGTVVTGTLTNGRLTTDHEIEIYPSGKNTKVRNLQVHGCPVEQAFAGQRVAINLQNVEVAEVQRGMQISVPGRFRPSSILDARVELLKGSPISLKGRTPIHFHHGTSELMALLIPLDRREIPAGEIGFARAILETPILAIPGDRFVFRRSSPMNTIGGGVVLDNHPRRGGKKTVVAEFLRGLDPGQADSLIIRLARQEEAKGVSESQILERSLETHDAISRHFVDLASQKQLVLLSQSPLVAVSPSTFECLCQQTVDIVGSYHHEEPLSPGISREQLYSEVLRKSSPICFRTVIDRLAAEKRIVLEQERVRLPSHQVSLSPWEASSKQKIEEVILKAGWEVPSLTEVLAVLDIPSDQARGLVLLLAREKRLVKISEDLWLHADSIARLKQLLAEQRKQSQTIDVAQFKALTEISRKYAIPLLEYLDRERITRRVGDQRVILV